MAASKAKNPGEIDKVKAKIAEQQARLKELEQKKLRRKNSEIVGHRVRHEALAELPLVPTAPRQPLNKVSQKSIRGKGGNEHETIESLPDGGL